MNAVTQSEAEVHSIASAEAGSEPAQTASFGTALLGFMITTTLTTSLMVLLSQG
jgi:hypothetical protein